MSSAKWSRTRPVRLPSSEAASWSDWKSRMFRTPEGGSVTPGATTRILGLSGRTSRRAEGHGDWHSGGSTSTHFWRFLCHAGGTMSWTVLTVGLVLVGLVAALALIPVLISQNPPEQPDDDDIAGMQ